MLTPEQADQQLRAAGVPVWHVTQLHTNVLAVFLHPNTNSQQAREESRKTAANLNGVTAAVFASASAAQSVLHLTLG